VRCWIPIEIAQWFEQIAGRKAIRWWLRGEGKAQSGNPTRADESHIRGGNLAQIGRVGTKAGRKWGPFWLCSRVSSRCHSAIMRPEIWTKQELLCPHVGMVLKRLGEQIAPEIKSELGGHPCPIDCVRVTFRTNWVPNFTQFPLNPQPTPPDNCAAYRQSVSLSSSDDPIEMIWSDHDWVPSVWSSLLLSNSTVTTTNRRPPHRYGR